MERDSLKIPFQLLDNTGTVIASGGMAWLYVQPRIIKYEDRYYVMISNSYFPGPGSPADPPNQYIDVGTEAQAIYEPDPSTVVKTSGSPA